MRLSGASYALGAALALVPLATGNAPASAQDFSITNKLEPANPVRRDLMRQLQAWWDAHAYYPRHASNNDEGGTVKVHLVIVPDGRIWTIDVVGSSGSRSIDTAGNAVFRGASVQPFPESEGKVEVDLSLHYVLAYRRGQPAVASYTPAMSEGTLKALAAQLQAAVKAGDTAAAARLSAQLSAGLEGTPTAQPAATGARQPFTITNEPAKSPVLETMLQRTCTGQLLLGAMPNRPWTGIRSWAQAVFFRKPDGTPWVKFYERGYPSLSPVTQIGKMVTWTGRQEAVGFGINVWYQWRQYTVWADSDNHLHGVVGLRAANSNGPTYNHNMAEDTVDLTCATEALPTVSWNDWVAQGNMNASPFDLSSADPP